MLGNNALVDKRARLAMRACWPLATIFVRAHGINHCMFCKALARTPMHVDIGMPMTTDAACCQYVKRLRTNVQASMLGNLFRLAIRVVLI